tara:strand:+ start:1047 stop:1229 length:183 start_codon:yes stop_codon:yes gene_type:complete
MANYAMAPKKRWYVAEDGKEIAQPFPNNQYQCEVIIEQLNDGLEENQFRNLTIGSEVIEK